MYSKDVEQILKSKKIAVGDRIKIDDFEGILMPRSDVGDTDSIVLKLDSGYNVGIKFEKGAKLEKLGHSSAKIGTAPIGNLSFDKSKPPISLIATGGTISSRVDYKTGGVSMLMEPDEILRTTPELRDFVNIKSIKSPFRIASEDMAPEQWQEIAKAAAKELNTDARGIIITHGTDTLHYTSAALSFMLQNLSKPVAVVGAQRSPDRASFDGGMNLACAAHYCLSDIAEVAIVMHGTTNDDYCLINRGTKVRKMHTSRRDAFRPINSLPIGKIWPDGKLDVMDGNFRMRSESKVVADTKFEEKVAQVAVYPGSDPSIIDFYVKKGFRGIVMQTTALGHVPWDTIDAKKSWKTAVKNAIKSGVVLVSASQTLYGSTHPHVYRAAIEMDEAGVIFAKDMLPEVAYVKLGWVLGHTKDMKKAREMFLANCAGEISERIVDEMFLY
ncbi:MAG: Glu-tRNA(Gln) amidotransferase subunit GatD [Nanoarchaeota archaeon]|nr:Glu-tRNA(Gln) amidotransferase subunit GatD [Nanoarchaeota archaeon]MBU4300851.1 Glu-tRNA(Gln) amidotransferase subunit GatD [Nanoarchaeota archaeon]MBU4451552.1 Glu-tRNA(Gln) amidotransferase subunit GatD [Nanoarchaeota archaeon]MCG2724483.1 Glu-tRNA(Gln) amidotransferase subunit GatD [archaeon]